MVSDKTLSIQYAVQFLSEESRLQFLVADNGV